MPISEDTVPPSQYWKPDTISQTHQPPSWFLVRIVMQLKSNFCDATVFTYLERKIHDTTQNNVNNMNNLLEQFMHQTSYDHDGGITVNAPKPFGQHTSAWTE